MKAVLMSIQPKWCELIANGKKTIEVRKSKPKLETPFKVYIYATWNGSKKEILVKQDGLLYCEDWRKANGLQRASGKVIGEFVCDSFYGITNFLPYDGEDCHHSVTQGVLEQTCLEDYEIEEYLGKKDGYGWHISELKIYDKPKELGEFYTRCNVPESKCKLCDNCFDRADYYGRHYAVKKITRSPQSWCYLEG